MSRARWSSLGAVGGFARASQEGCRDIGGHGGTGLNRVERAQRGVCSFPSPPSARRKEKPSNCSMVLEASSLCRKEPGGRSPEWSPQLRMMNAAERGNHSSWGIGGFGVVYKRSAGRARTRSQRRSLVWLGRFSSRASLSRTPITDVPPASASVLLAVLGVWTLATLFGWYCLRTASGSAVSVAAECFRGRECTSSPTSAQP
jgi:hypothetical protein